MSRRNKLCTIVAAAIPFSLVVQTGVADDLAAYLERLGLTELLARHLEQRLEQTPEAEREDVVRQLSDVYARLLEHTDDAELQADLESRGRKLLAAAGPEQTDELRLAMLRASYRAAESTAERHRLRLIPPEEVETLRESFHELAGELEKLRVGYHQKITDASRRLGRSAGAEAVMIAEKLEQLQRAHDQSTFINAWSLYYAAWLSEHRELARQAERLFARLLRIDAEAPTPHDVSVDLRELEVIARSILGMALAKSVSASAATALEWLELLEAPGTFAPIQQELTAWKLAIYLQHHQYAQVREIWIAHSESPDPIPLPWVRLVAVSALEAPQTSREAADLSRLAMTELASRGELEQVLDLGNRYGLEALGDKGFAVQYVRAVQQYHKVREEHGEERPTTSSSLIEQYASIVTRLRSALEQSDATLYEAAAANARLLIGWCLFFQGSFLDARLAFEEAAAGLAPDQAAEALWMAIVSLDRVVQADPTVAAADELAALVDRFLTEFPSHEHAPALRLRRAVASDTASRQAVDELLSIPANSEVYLSARVQAASMLYRRYREAPLHDQARLANEYLAVVVPLLAGQFDELSSPTSITAAVFAAHCRYLLDVALRDDVRRIDAAQQAIAWLDALNGHAEIDWTDLKPELEFRRLQERLLSDDVAAAEKGADGLHEQHAENAWAQQAQRVMFRQAYQQWRESKNDPPDLAQLERVVRFGSRIIAASDRGSGADVSRDFMSYMLAVAEAQMHLWRATGSADRAAEAKKLYEALLVQQSRDAGILRAVAELAQALDQLDRAADCWRLLAAGADPAQPLFYEAKFNLIQILATTDPSRAREVMAQHRLLYPDYGPEPWGSRLRALDERLGNDTQGDAPKGESQGISP